MKGHGRMVRRTSELIARVLRRRANENVKHAPSAIRCRSVRQKPAASGLVDNKGKAPHVRSLFPLEVQVHSRRGAGVCVVEKVFFVLGHAPPSVPGRPPGPGYGLSRLAPKIQG